MAANLADALLAHPPRETSGSIAANRFEFQRTWALCHLLRIHESNNDYLLVMEFHDDVLVLDSAKNPQFADFFQVKTRTKKGPWSLADLGPAAPIQSGKTSKKSVVPAQLSLLSQQASLSFPLTAPTLQAPTTSTPSLPKSIFGKLIAHLSHFGANVRAMSLVSNEGYNLPLADDASSVDRDKLCLTELKTEEFDKLRTALQKELSLKDPPELDKVYLHVTDFNVKDHSTYGEGLLSSFLYRWDPEERFVVHTLFRTISDELTRRATNEWQPASLDDLSRMKGLSRAQFEAMLHATTRPSFDPDLVCNELTTQLRNEEEKYRSVVTFKRTWDRYEVERMDPSNQLIQTVRARSREVAMWLTNDQQWTTLRECMHQGLAEYVNRFGAPDAPLDTMYISVTVLWEMKEHEAGNVPQANPQPTKKAP